jgi:hypothetical protein
MNWSDIGKTIAGAAPLIGSVIGGPAGGAVGTLISKALGCENKPDAVAEALKADPEALLKLEALEKSHQVELERLLLEEEKARLVDVQSARSREVEITKNTGNRDVNLYVLAWTVIFGFFALMALLCFRALPEDSNGVVFMLFGSLATGFGQVLQYFFGSSKSSADKTKMIGR